jgi:hypothetical protein
MRVVFNPTRSYLSALMSRKLGGDPFQGLAINLSIPFARPFTPSEITQLDRYDIPYYFRILGEDGMFYWPDPANGNKIQEKGFSGIKVITPFWSILADSVGACSCRHCMANCSARSIRLS